MTTSTSSEAPTSAMVATGRQGVAAGAASTLIAGAFIVPLVFWIGDDETFVIPKLVATTAVVVIGLVQLMRTLPRLPGGLHRIDLAVAAWIALVALSYLTSVDQSQSWWGERFQRQGLFTNLLYAATYVIARLALTDRARMRLAARSVAAAATGAALYGLIQRFGWDPIWDSIPANRVFATIGQTNSLGAFLSLSIPLTLGLAVMARRHRTTYVLAATAQILTLGLTLSRGAYLALAVGTALLFVFALTRRGWQWPATLAITASLAMSLTVLATISPGVDKVTSRVIDRAVSDDEWSTGSIRNHMDLWIVAGHMIADNPVVGTGPETYPEVFADYRDDVLSQESAVRLRIYRVESPHNIVLTTAQGSGIPAALAQLAAFGLAAAAAIRRGLTRLDNDAELLWLAVGTAIIGGFLASMFITADLTTTWLTWILIGAAATASPQAPVGTD